jgi:signal transduction histidine kinase
MLGIINKLKKMYPPQKTKSTILVFFLSVVLTNSVCASSENEHIVHSLGEVILLNHDFSFSSCYFSAMATNGTLGPILSYFQMNLPILFGLLILLLTLTAIIQLEKRINLKGFMDKLMFFPSSTYEAKSASEKSFETDQKFIEIIAHELNNTFHIMKGYSNHLNEEFDSLSKHEKKKYINIISKNIEINYSLLKRLLIWNKSNTASLQLNKKETNLKLLVENMLLPHLLFASRKKITIINNLPDELVFNADKDVLRTVLSNLVNNAIKYSSENSKIIIDAKKVSDKLQINIKDQGKGLSVHEIEQLLSQNKENISFGSNSNSSNGFGINICKYLAKFHSGELYFESKKDNGTKVSLILPC